MSMQIFLKLDEIEGESADAHHKGEIELIGWTWGLAEPAAGGSSARASGGASAGKLIVRDIAIEKHTDLASALLMLFAAEGKLIANGVITNRRATGGEFLILKMTDILVTSVAQATTIEANQVAETITLAFRKVEVEYRPTLTNGTLAPPTVFGWDLGANRPL